MTIHQFPLNNVTRFDDAMRQTLRDSLIREMAEGLQHAANLDLKSKQDVADWLFFHSGRQYTAGSIDRHADEAAFLAREYRATLEMVRF